MLPHRAAAYNLAFWMAGNSADAADIVQDAYLRALRYFEDYRGGSARAWLLMIVRTTGLNLLAQRRKARTISLSQANDSDESTPFDLVDDKVDLEFDLIQKEASATMDQIIQALPSPYREIIVLREIEELSYKEIAEVTELPIGTVMSRLARARKFIQLNWGQKTKEGGSI